MVGTGAEIAYYSMEIALDDALPTFSGGLGVLAGDHLRAAADRGLPVVGVSLLYARGFFSQSLEDGGQREDPVDWSPRTRMEELGPRVVLTVSGRPVSLRVWLATVEGVDGHRVPVLFLDSDVDGNEPADRAITDRLYASDPYHRLRQEAVLGIGGPLALDTLGFDAVRLHHLNEGHGALVPVSLLARRVAGANPAGVFAGGIAGGIAGGNGGGIGGPLAGLGATDVEDVRRRCVFTTHTPVPAGHDRFPADVVAGVLGTPLLDALGALDLLEDGALNMTALGMRCAGTVNGVSLRHRDVTQAMFPGPQVDSVTNGVHSVTWAAPATAAVFDRCLPGWRRDSRQLRYAVGLSLDELVAAHGENKAALAAEVRRLGGAALDPDVLTLGVARRFATYKRNDLVLSDLERLSAIAECGPIQVVFAGKAHPRDGEAKEMLRRVVSHLGTHEQVTVAFLEDYGMSLGRLLCAGSDVWLNTPVAPNEASGTSGMKAALNGVPSLSTLDGWWIEGWLEGVTGWSIAPRGEEESDADALYRVLEEVVVPTYYKDRETLFTIGRNAIALNGSFFSAHRMVDEYARRAYHATGAARSGPHGV